LYSPFFSLPLAAVSVVRPKPSPCSARAVVAAGMSMQRPIPLHLAPMESPPFLDAAIGGQSFQLPTSPLRTPPISPSDISSTRPEEVPAGVAADLSVDPITAFVSMSPVKVVAEGSSAAVQRPAARSAAPMREAGFVAVRQSPDAMQLLEELFDATALEVDDRLSPPLRSRKLPKSFWTGESAVARKRKREVKRDAMLTPDDLSPEQSPTTAAEAGRAHASKWRRPGGNSAASAQHCPPVAIDKPSLASLLVEETMPDDGASLSTPHAPPTMPPLPNDELPPELLFFSHVVEPEMSSERADRPASCPVGIALSEMAATDETLPFRDDDFWALPSTDREESKSVEPSYGFLPVPGEELWAHHGAPL